MVKKHHKQKLRIILSLLIGFCFLVIQSSITVNSEKLIDNESSEILPNEILDNFDLTNSLLSTQDETYPVLPPIGIERGSSGRVISSIKNQPDELDHLVQDDTNLLPSLMWPNLLDVSEPFNGDPYVLSNEITKDNKTIHDGDTMLYKTKYVLKYMWELPDDTHKNGDVIRFTIPREFIIEDILDFNILSPDGQRVGTGQVRGNSNGYWIDMQVTKYVEENSAISGEFELAFHVDETYVKEGDTTIKIPGGDLDVKFPAPPKPGGGGNSSDGSGKVNYDEMKKSGEIQTSTEKGAYIGWGIKLGRDALLGQKEEDGTITKKFDSFDEIEHIYIHDEPENQKLIPYGSVSSSKKAYGWYKTFWKDHPFTLGGIPEEEMGLIGDGPDYYSFKADIIKRVKDQDNKFSDQGFTYYEFWYYTVPLDRFEETELKNEAVVTIVGKDNTTIEYKLVDTVKWTVAGGVAEGKTGNVKLEKYDSKSKESLAGANFDLYRNTPSGPVKVKKDLVTQDDGTISQDRLVIGDYYFVEIKAPEGYELSDKQYEFSITSDTIQKEEMVKVEVPNTHIADRELNLTKVDEDGEPIASDNPKYATQFHLEKKGENGNWQRVGTRVYQTDSEGKISLGEEELKELPAPNYYRFKEVKAPFGYELPTGDDMYTKEFYLDVYDVEPKELKQVNKKLNHELSLEKIIEFNTSTNSPTAVDGIKFVIQARSGTNWQAYTDNEFTTDKNGKFEINNTTHPGLIESMIDSSYTAFRFREKSVPDKRGLQDPEYPKTGVEPVEGIGDDFSVPIPIDEYEKSTNMGVSLNLPSLTLENKLIRYNLTLTKLDSVDKRPLDGAEFTLTQKGHPDTAKVYQSKNGEFLFDDLIINRTYNIKETKAPAGYGIRDESFDIRLGLNEEMHVEHINNEGISTTLKKDKDFKWDGSQLQLDFKIENTAVPKIPMTGGMGVTIYSVIGVLLMGTGFMLYKYVENTKRGENN